LTAADLGSQILEKERIHCAFEADMQFADLAFAECENADTGKGQLLEEGSNMFLVTGYAIQCLSDDDVELFLAGVFDKLLITRAQMTGATERAVGVRRYQAPALALYYLFAYADLVLDRGVALQI
jgi:hypothetical protein